MIVKIGFDTADNEPCEFCPHSVYRSLRFEVVPAPPTSSSLAGIRTGRSIPDSSSETSGTRAQPRSWMIFDYFDLRHFELRKLNEVKHWNTRTGRSSSERHCIIQSSFVDTGENRPFKVAPLCNKRRESVCCKAAVHRLELLNHTQGCSMEFWLPRCSAAWL